MKTLLSILTEQFAKPIIAEQAIVNDDWPKSSVTWSTTSSRYDDGSPAFDFTVTTAPFEYYEGSQIVGCFAVKQVTVSDVEISHSRHGWALELSPSSRPTPAKQAMEVVWKENTLANVPDEALLASLGDAPSICAFIIDNLSDFDPRAMGEFDRQYSPHDPNEGRWD